MSPTAIASGSAPTAHVCRRGCYRIQVASDGRSPGYRFPHRRVDDDRVLGGEALGLPRPGVPPGVPEQLLLLADCRGRLRAQLPEWSGPDGEFGSAGAVLFVLRHQSRGVRQALPEVRLWRILRYSERVELGLPDVVVVNGESLRLGRANDAEELPHDGRETARPPPLAPQATGAWAPST